MFENFMHAYGMEIIGVILTAIVGIFADAIRRLYERHVNTAEKQSVVKTVVQAVEQIYKDLHGEEKLREAISYARKLLEDKGIHITETELRLMIEATVGEFNEVFKKPWEDNETAKASRLVDPAGTIGGFELPVHEDAAAAE